jgi:histidinol-phosphate aminotransferase
MKGATNSDSMNRAVFDDLHRSSPLFQGILSGRTVESHTYKMPTNGRTDLVPLHLNENLFEVEGELPAVLLDRQTLSRYPTGGSCSLVNALAEHEGVEPEAVFVNAGACAILNSIFSLCTNAGAVAVLPSPTWSYYDEILSGLDVRLVHVPQLLLPGGYRYDIGAIALQAARVGATMVVLTSPNNPTGNRVGYHQVRDLALQQPGSLVILDEAYFGFAPPDPMPVASLIADCPNVIVVRSFSKALGMAYLRVGYALAGEGAQVLLRRLPVPFGVSGYAQELAIARLGDRAYLAAVRRACQAARQVLATRLGDLPGFLVYDSDANFVLLRTPPGRASIVRDHLMERGYLVKLSDEAEMSDHLRITLADATVMERVATLIIELESRADQKP